jgi:hypothetical protein
MHQKKWTLEEDNLVKKYWPKTPLQEMQKYVVSRSVKAIRSRANLLKVTKAVGFGKHKKWNQEDLDYLKIHYSNTLNIQLTTKFNCSLKSLYCAANLINIKKSKEHLALIGGNILKMQGIKTRFKKGHVPMNKDKKQWEYMTADQIKRSAKTQFKKGIIPHNTVAIGFERVTVDGYLEVKIGDFENSSDNFQLKHRMIYERQYGTIPAKHQVRFKDGNKFNFEISNLILVSREDSLKINIMSDVGIVKRFLKVKDPVQIKEVIDQLPYVIELKRKSLQLNHKIKNHEGNN